MRSASCRPEIRKRYKKRGYYLLLHIIWVVGLRVGVGVPVWHRANLPLLHDLEKEGHQSLATTLNLSPLVQGALSVQGSLELQAVKGRLSLCSCRCSGCCC
jgi:hypothetical protein